MAVDDGDVVLRGQRRRLVDLDVQLDAVVGHDHARRTAHAAERRPRLVRPRTTQPGPDDAPFERRAHGGSGGGQAEAQAEQSGTFHGQPAIPSAPTTTRGSRGPSRVTIS